MSKYEQLKHDLRERSEGGIALAFSGGVDSALLLALAAEAQRSPSSRNCMMKPRFLCWL